MAQSKEWPDLPWVPPRSWTNGRPQGPPKLLVVHYTAGAEGRTSAEDGAAYDQRRTDGTSAHYYIDRDTTIQCVETNDMAHTARRHGNRIGIHYEMCGTVQTRAQWLDEASRPTIRRTAAQIVRDGRKWGIPLKRITTAQTRAAYYSGGAGGICGHVNVTEAFPEDSGDHTDPGATFPWDVLMADVAEIAAGEEDLVTTQDEFNDLFANALTDSTVAARFKALAVGYVGAPLPAGKSAIGVTSEMYAIAQSSAQKLTLLAAAVPGIADTVRADLERIDAENDAVVAAAELADIERHQTQLVKIGQTPQATVDLLVDPTTPDEDAAQLIRDLLADRPGVLALLATG